MRPNFELYFKYLPRKGQLVWVKPTTNAVRKGDVAGFSMQHKYVCVCLYCRYYLIHRVMWYLKTGKWPKHNIDHRDGDPANNKWKNLRKASNSQNQMNKKKPANNTSGYKGVCWHKHGSRWCAMIEKNGKQVWLGAHATPKLAHAAYVAAANKQFGEFARAA